MSDENYDQREAYYEAQRRASCVGPDNKPFTETDVPDRAWLQRQLEDATRRADSMMHSVINARQEALDCRHTIARQRDALRVARDVHIDVLSSLVAAHSLLSHGGKTAAASDKMFDQMLADYAASIEHGRNALAAIDAALKEGGE